jgi:hypothetical protein
MDNFDTTQARTGRNIMVKPVSEQLSDLSKRAKKAEDEAAAAQQKASADIERREEQIKADAANRKAQLQESASKAQDTVVSTWDGLTTQVQSDVDSLRAKIDFKKYEHDRDKAAQAADDAEDNAVRAINFAFDSIDYAETAVLDAIMARETAEAM